MPVAGKVVILSSFMDNSVHRQQQQQLAQPPAAVAVVPDPLDSCSSAAAAAKTPEKLRVIPQHCCDRCGYKSPHRHALDRHTQVG